MNDMMNLPPTALEPRQQAKLLFFLGWRELDIARHLQIPQPTVNSWKRKEDWENIEPFEKIKTTLEARYTFLLIKPEKSEKELQELKTLGKQVKDIIAPPKTRGSNAKMGSKDFDWDKFRKRINEGFQDFFPFQRNLINNFEKQDKRSDFSRQFLIGKTRQGGLTYAMAFYRLLRLLNHNNNQIYISASKNQAYQAKSYIQKFIKDLTDITIGGRDKITFKEGLEFHFLPANPATAQGYSGDVTCDEFLWMPRFDELTRVVSACATQSRYNVVYLSSASSKSHPGYAFWEGRKWNKKHPKNLIDVSHKNLKKGKICVDYNFRQIITIHDAIAGGLNLVDIEQLRMRHSDPADFANLFEFQFLDAQESAFTFDEITACMVDALEEWQDWKPYENPHRPIGKIPVAIGYDPARSHDASAIVVMAVPNEQYPYFRLIEKHYCKGADYEEQAKNIRKIIDRYHVVHLGIDNSGIGAPVAERIDKYFPRLIRYQSSVDSKINMVIQAKNLFKHKLIRLDHGDSDIVKAFLAIKRKMTASGLMTYHSGRSEEIAHADLSWAVMYAMSYQRLDGSYNEAKSTVMTF